MSEQKEGNSFEFLRHTLACGCENCQHYREVIAGATGAILESARMNAVLNGLPELAGILFLKAAYHFLLKDMEPAQREQLNGQISTLLSAYESWVDHERAKEAQQAASAPPAPNAPSTGTVQ